MTQFKSLNWKKVDGGRMVWNWQQGARKTFIPSSRSTRLKTGMAERAAGNQCPQGRARFQLVRAGRKEWAPLSDLATEFLFLAKQQRTLLFSFTVCTLTNGARGPWDRGHVPTQRLCASFRLCSRYQDPESAAQTPLSFIPGPVFFPTPSASGLTNLQVPREHRDSS